MNESDRIRALRAQGKIDDDQAARLLEALGELDSIDPPGAGAGRGGHEPGSDGPSGAASERPGVAAAAPSGPADGGAETRTDASRPDRARPDDAGILPRATDATVTRWVVIDLLAGDVDVRVDPEIDRPELAEAGEGVALEEADDGWRIRQVGRGADGWLDRLIDGVTRHVRLRLAVPSGCGVRLAMKAGDVDLHDVPAVAGTLLAGDVEVRGARAVDLEVRAGDVDVELDPAPGLHRLFLTVGDADLRLPTNSDVAVHARVSIGDARADPPLRADGGGIGGTIEGTIGSGEGARVEIGVKTGDLSVKVG